MQKYNVNQLQISNLLNMVDMGEIVIPEIQRPFVWETTKIRDLLDSIYKGYPVGYIITWKNPDVRLKDGTKSSGRTILIDGQQRITALRAAILGHEIMNKNYRYIRVKIAFQPTLEEFKTSTAATENDSLWISDISEVFSRETNLFEFVEKYCAKNPEANKVAVQTNIQRLLDIQTKQIGYIDLDHSLDIETVTEIFIRINSAGVVLGSSDFAMSKIAAHGDYGVNLRKLIDYFCHLAKEPKFYKDIAENDNEFVSAGYLQKIAWLKNETEDLYDPDYSDVLRVVSLRDFERGRVADLVSLLSGRDFETREYKKTIVDASFKKLESGIIDFVNENHFKKFMMIIKSAGYVDKSMITAQNAMNFAYSIYLKLRALDEKNATIEKTVRRWFVMSMLTGRHSGSFETVFESDIKKIKSLGIVKHLADIEEAELGEAFWKVRLVQELEKSSSSNPYINAFFASQVKASDKGFLSNDITVRELIEIRGDLHHIFPKDLMAKSGFTRYEYNQVANFVQTQTEINIAISNKEPKKYMAEVLDQMKKGEVKYGLITDEEQLRKNLRQNCVPENIFELTSGDFADFLQARRVLMAKKIEKYYKSL